MLVIIFKLLCKMEGKIKILIIIIIIINKKLSYK
jgi:hypothetical protein